jgi:hypothetical protein
MDKGAKDSIEQCIIVESVCVIITVNKIWQRDVEQ